MPAHKLTRKELKRDPFKEWTGSTVHVLQEHFAKIAVGVIVAIVLIFAVSYYFKGQTQSKYQASQLLNQGQSLLARGAFAGARQRLQECVDKHGGTLFGLQARLNLSHAMMAMGENEVALQTLADGQRSLDEDDPLLDDFMTSQAAILVNLGRAGEAAVIYSDLLDGAESDAERFEFSFRLADCYESDGRFTEAVTLLEQLDAACRSGEIGSLNPDLETRLQELRALAGARSP